MRDDERDDAESGQPAEPSARGSLRPGRPESLRPRATSIPPSQGSGGIRNVRVVFAALWIVAQAILVMTADRRPDGAFGFRMFSESSTMKIVLYREVAGPGGERTRLHVDDGIWSARDAGGLSRRFSWYERVPAPFWPFDREVHASYGAAAQLARLQAALDDVATHLPDDAETKRLLLDVTVRKNGREAQVHHLTSAER